MMGELSLGLLLDLMFRFVADLTIYFAVGHVIRLVVTWSVSSLADVDKPINKSHNSLIFFCELCKDRMGFRYL